MIGWRRFAARLSVLALGLAVFTSACQSRVSPPAPLNQAPVDQAPPSQPERSSTVPPFVAMTPGETTTDLALRDQMIAKARDEGELAVGGIYASLIRDRLPGFKEKYPFITVKPFDATAAETVSRVAAEAGSPSLDVVGLDDMRIKQLAERGALQRYELPYLVDFLPGTQPADGLYVGVGGNPRPQGVYNRARTRPEETPTTWADAMDPKWSGRTMVPADGTDLPLRLAYVWRDGDQLNWDRSSEWLGSLARNQSPRVGTGRDADVQRVADGDVAILWWGDPSAAGRLATDSGASLGLIAFPKMPFYPYSVGILKGAPHPGGAWLLVDYLTSPEGQTALTDNVAALFPFNLRAEPGKLTRWMTDQGVSLGAADVEGLPTAQSYYTDEAIARSEQLFTTILRPR